jgi:hypothetical protein
VALSWFSGCESGGPVAGAGSEFSALSNGGGGTPTFQTSTVRSGVYALLTPHDGYARIHIAYASSATNVFRLYFRVTSNPTNTVPIILAANSTSSTARGWRVFLTSAGKIGWSFNNLGSNPPDGTGADSVSLTDWNLLEVKLTRDTTVGGMEIFLNGVQQVSDFTHSTTSGTSLTTTTLFFGNDLDQPGTNQSGIDIWWDDMAFATGSTYIGAGQCVAIQGKAGTPTYDAWTKNGGATSAADAWSETPWSGTKNCSDNVVSDRQTMLLDDAAVTSKIPSGSVINGAMLLAVAKIVTSGNFKLTHRISGVDTDSATKVLSTTDTMEPNGVNGDSMDVFTPSYADLTSGTMEIGAVSNSTNTATVEDMWLMVDFTPPPPPGTGSVVITGYAPTVSNPGGATTTSITPGTGALVLTGPFFVRVLVIGDLVLSWNVLEKLNEIMPVFWDVFGPGPVGTLALTWTVKESITPLLLQWRVIPNLQALFVDIQGPVATVVEIS